MDNKFVLTLGVLGLLCSCSVKKDANVLEEGTGKQEQEQEQETTIERRNEEVKKVPDQDFDLIPDEFDSQPKVANLPQISPVGLRASVISYRVRTDNLGGEKEISLLMENIKISRLLVRSIIDKAVRDDLAQQSVDLGPLNDEETWGKQLYTPWDEQAYVRVKKDVLTYHDYDFVPYSGIYKLRYKLDLSGLNQVDYIESIRIKAEFRDFNGGREDIFAHLMKDNLLKNLRITTEGAEELETLDVFETISFENDPEQMRSHIEQRSQLVIGVEDFTFGRFGKKVNYLDFVQNLHANLACIIVANKEEVRRFFVVPDQTLASALEHLGYKSEFDQNGEISSFEGESTTVLLPGDLRDPKPDFLAGKILKAFGDADSDDQLVAGHTYVISISEGMKVFQSNVEVSEDINNHEFQSSLSVKNLREGDIVEFIINGHRERMRTSTSRRVVEAVVTKKYCEHDRGREPFRAVSFTVAAARCIDTDHRGYCGVNTTNPAGYAFLTPINFSSNIANYKLRFSNGTLVPLSDVSSFDFYNSGKNVIGVLEVHEKMISSGRKIEFVETLNKSHSVTVGFNSYADCGHRGQGKNFRFVNPRDGQSWSESHPDIVKNFITIKRIGAAR